MDRTDSVRDGVPADYPGRIVAFPPGVSHVVMALIGVQSEVAQTHTDFITTLLDLCCGDLGPARIERAHHVDSAGLPTTLIIAYWSARNVADAWWASMPVHSWWAGLPLTGEAGYFREILAIPQARFNYAAGTEDRVGSAAVLPLAPCATFGYWGAYRDRLAASRDDDFASPLPAPPLAQVRVSRGRRLQVSVPDNLCFIREGQGWGACDAEERAIWDAQMNGVIDVWVARLGSDPAATGCLSIRDCTELDSVSGDAIARRSQFAYLLSLTHIEHAARTDPAHLAVHRAFVRMYTEPRFTPRMHVWVELAVVKHDEVVAEYVNCHSATGLVPYFESTAC